MSGKVRSKKQYLTEYWWVAKEEIISNGALMSGTVRNNI